MEEVAHIFSYQCVKNHTLGRADLRAKDSSAVPFATVLRLAVQACRTPAGRDAVVERLMEVAHVHAPDARRPPMEKVLAAANILGWTAEADEMEWPEASSDGDPGPADVFAEEADTDTDTDTNKNTGITHANPTDNPGHANIFAEEADTDMDNNTGVDLRSPDGDIEMEEVEDVSEALSSPSSSAISVLVFEDFMVTDSPLSPEAYESDLDSVIPGNSSVVSESVPSSEDLEGVSLSPRSTEQMWISYNDDTGRFQTVDARHRRLSFDMTEPYFVAEGQIESLESRTLHPDAQRADRGFQYNSEGEVSDYEVGGYVLRGRVRFDCYSK